MRTLPLVVLSALVLSACDAAGNVNSGPLALGIVAGNNQTATAGEDRLPDPVVGKMVRQPDGGITFRLVSTAYAQGTVVNGSPVPGAVVCAVSTEGQLEAFTPCTNTDNNGTATFFFAPGTVAGEARAEIRGTVEGEPAVFDTVVAMVEPGPVAKLDIRLPGPSTSLRLNVGDTIYLGDYIASARDEFGNEIPVEDALNLPGTEFSHAWADNVSTGSGSPRDYGPDIPGWYAVVPDTAGMRRLPAAGWDHSYSLRLRVDWRGEFVGHLLVDVP